jgi:glycosyltransferase involved in cell wall biosynthesis
LDTNPHISVIIPTFDEEKLLGQTLAQFTTDLRLMHRLEIIVSDGGSTDTTLCVAEATADVVLRNTSGVRQNISIGRNAGARVARGTILLFINADTLIDQIGTFMQALARTIQNKTVAGATCNVCIHRAEEQTTDRVFHAIYNRYFRFLNIIGLGMGRGECQIVRRDLFHEVGGYNEKIAAGEDFDLFVRLRRRGKIVFLPSECVRESPRRYRRYGYLRVSMLWFVNAIAVLVLGKSVTKEWKPIR